MILNMIFNVSPGIDGRMALKSVVFTLNKSILYMTILFLKLPGTCVLVISNLLSRYRRMISGEVRTARKSILKLVEQIRLVAKYCKMWKI